MAVFPRLNSSSDFWTSCSLSVSRAAVASSRRRIGVPERIAREMQIRCFWPPERLVWWT
jgi:hypothetical protein